MSSASCSNKGDFSSLEFCKNPKTFVEVVMSCPFLPKQRDSTRHSLPPKRIRKSLKPGNSSQTSRTDGHFVTQHNIIIPQKCMDKLPAMLVGTFQSQTETLVEKIASCVTFKYI